MNTESMYTALGITPAVHRFGEEVLAGLRTRFDEIDRRHAAQPRRRAV